jgi:hypothetical protein
MGICGSDNKQSKSKMCKMIEEDNGSAPRGGGSHIAEMKDIETFNRKSSMTAPPKVKLQLLEPHVDSKKPIMVEPPKKFENVWEEMGMENPDDHNQKKKKKDPPN